MQCNYLNAIKLSILVCGLSNFTNTLVVHSRKGRRSVCGQMPSCIYLLSNLLFVVKLYRCINLTRFYVKQVQAPGILLMELTLQKRASLCRRQPAPSSRTSTGGEVNLIISLETSTA